MLECRKSKLWQTESALISASLKVAMYSYEEEVHAQTYFKSVEVVRDYVSTNVNRNLKIKHYAQNFAKKAFTASISEHVLNRSFEALTRRTEIST
jgi:hypothetical protein